MPKTAIIIQARMGSTRLPGKVLEPLGNQTVLWHVIKRAQAVEGVDIVCCAIPQNPNSDPLAAEALRCEAVVVRGDEYDVLNRYHQAATEIGADIIMRITSDCPLTDPNICAAVLRLVTDGMSSYSCNNMPPTFPHGLDCEAFTYDLLEQAAREAKLPHEREHVTPWMRSSSHVNRANFSCSIAGLHHHRWTLDYAEDLLFLRAVNKHLGATPETADMDQILNVLRRYPELVAINAMHVERACPITPKRT